MYKLGERKCGAIDLTLNGIQGVGENEGFTECCTRLSHTDRRSAKNRQYMWLDFLRDLSGVLELLIAKRV
jgi:hypothetical protein